MDRAVSLSVGSVGVATWTVDADCVLDSVVWDGQATTTFASLSLDAAFDANTLGAGVKTQHIFALGHAGQVSLQTQLGLQLDKGTVVALNCLAGGCNVLLIISQLNLSPRDNGFT